VGRHIQRGRNKRQKMVKQKRSTKKKERNNIVIIKNKQKDNQARRYKERDIKNQVMKLWWVDLG